MYKKLNINSSRIRGSIIKLYPTDEQKEIFNTHINLFRYTYNWALNEAQEYYKEHNKYIGKDELFRRFSDLRNSTEWLKEIPLHSARLAISHLDNAFKLFFKHKNKFPRFKSNKYSKKCVHYRNEIYAFNFDENSVRIPGLPLRERVLCKSHNVPLDVDRYYSCTITFDGKDYWLSVNSERKSIEQKELSTESIGIDVGQHKFAQLSNGKVYQTPKILKTLEKRNRHQQSRLSKMRNRRLNEARRAKTKLEEIPFTQNEIKLKNANIQLRNRIKNIRRSFLHQSTTEIANTLPKRIVMEDLSIMEMSHQDFNNKDFVTHSMWYKFREYLAYKAEDRGIEFVLADKNFPSSQICSRCGSIKKSSFRTHICDVCGLRIDRDLNAAINLSRYT